MIDPEAPAELDSGLFRTFVETSDAVAYVLRPDRPDTPPLYVAPQAERILGVSREFLEQAHRELQTLVHPDDRERVLARRAAALETGTFDEEFRIVPPDGRIRWIRDRARVLEPAEGRPRLWLGLVTDVTARREAAAEAQLDSDHLADLLRQLPGAVFQLTNDVPRPRMTYMSPQTEGILGWPAERWLADPEFWLRLIDPDDAERTLTAWTRSVEREEPFDGTYRMRRADGNVVWIHERTVPVRDADGRVTMWQGFCLDITPSRLADEERRASEARYRALVEQLPAVVYVDSNEEVPQNLYVSPNCADLLGIPASEHLAERRRWPQAMHPDDSERVNARWRESIATGEPFHVQYRYVRPDGRIVWVRDSSVLVRDPAGRPVYWQGVILDITRQIQTEEELRASEERYRALIEGIPAVIYEMDLDDERRTLYTSPQVEELLGYSRDEWLEQPDIWIELLHPDDREIELAAHDLHTATGEPWRREYRLIAVDGRVVWVRDQAVLLRRHDGQPRAWQGVMLDITRQKDAEDELRRAKDDLELRVLARTTELAEANEMMLLEIGERRRVERELRETEARYRRLVEDLPVVVYLWQTRELDDGATHWYVSPQLEQMLGFRPSEWLERWGIWEERLHPHDHGRVMAASGHSERTGEPFEMTYRYLAKDGRVVWVHDIATLLSRDDDGRPFIFQGVMLDVTAQKDAEVKAAAAERRFRELTEAGPVITYAFAMDYSGPEARVRLDYVSPQIGDVLGMPTSEWAGNMDAWFSMIHPDDRDRVVAESSRQLETGGEWNVDFRMIAADGHIVWLHDRGRCIERDERGRPWRFQGAYVEITDRRERELRLDAEAAQFRDLIDGMPGIPWTELVDPETGRRRFTFIGSQVVAVTGYTAEELMGENEHFERLVHPDDRERVMAKSARSDRTGEPWEDVYRLVARDGTVRWLHASGRQVSPPGEAPVVWQGVSIPIDDALARRMSSAFAGGPLVAVNESSGETTVDRS